MFYAKDNASTKIDIYLALLEKSINEGSNGNYWSFFTNAFTLAHELAVGSKTFFDVETDAYDVVNILVKNNSDYFKTLDPGKINMNTFSDVKNFMGSLRQSNSVIG